MNNDSDFDLAMQKIWREGALIFEKRKSDDLSSIIYSESIEQNLSFAILWQSCLSIL